MDDTRTNGEIYNIGSNQRVTVEELARRVIDRTGSASTLRYVPYEQAYGPGYEDMRHRAPCLDKIGAAIGYKPSTSLDQILDVVIASVREQIRRGA